MREIPLTRGLVALVDDDVFDGLARHRWHAHRSRNTHYARRNAVDDQGRRTTVMMHRVILGTSAGGLVDHRNGDGLDNRRANLRECDPLGNAQNRRPVGRTSRFKGVSWEKSRNLWQVRLRINGHQRGFGRFTDEVQAARAYDAAARRHHGDFAVTNFPLDHDS